MSEPVEVTPATETTPDFNFEVDLGGGTSPEISAETNAAPVATPGENPAWKEMLDILPAEFRGQVTPHLQKWDTGVNERFAKIREEATAPYKEYQQFVDQQVNPAELASALQVWNQLNSDPLSVYNRMTPMLQQMGLLQAVQEAVAAEEEAQEQAAVPPEIQQKLEQLEQQQKLFTESVQQAQQMQELQQYRQQVDAQINSEFKQIEEMAGGPMPDWLRVEVINRAQLMMDRDNKPTVSMLDAFNEVQQLRRQMLENRPGQQAPRVVPSGGGIPAPQPNPDAVKTFDGRAQAVKEIIDRYKTS